MDNPLDKDIVRSIDAIDMVTGTVAKPIVEKLVSQVAGNGNMVSGVVKLGLAMGAAKWGGSNRVTKALAIGAGMDGAEDIIISVGMKGGISPTTSTSEGGF